MKKLILATCFVIGATTMSFAQNSGTQGHPVPTAEDNAKNYKTMYKLSDEQTAKIAAIFTAQAAMQDSMTKAFRDYNRSQMALIKATPQGAKQDSMTKAFNNQSTQRGIAQAKAITMSFRAKVKSVLTPDQAAEFDKSVAAVDAASNGRGGLGASQNGTKHPPAN